MTHKSFRFPFVVYLRVRQHENVVVTGQSGLGKSHVFKALGRGACVLKLLAIKLKKNQEARLHGFLFRTAIESDFRHDP